MHLAADILTAGFALAAFAALGSGFLHGFTGFGGALLLVPSLALLYGPVAAMATTHLIAGAATLALMPAAAREATWSELRPMMAAIALATPFGVWFAVTQNPGAVRAGMGVFILAFALAMMTGWRYAGPRGRAASAAVGAVSGLVNGATGVGGPPLALYFLSAPEGAGPSAPTSWSRSAC